MVGTRYLGKQGLKGSAQGLGCMSLTKGFYDPSEQHHDEAASIEVLQTALNSGISLLNTADLYGPYVNETLIGKVIKDFPREKVVIASKFGPMFKDGGIHLDLSPEYIRSCIDGQLKRLGVEYLDLWVLRCIGAEPDPAVWEEAIRTVKSVVESGKVKYFGLSEVTPNQIRAAHAIQPVSAIELEWSLFSRECEDEVVPLCRELGIGFLAYSPMGRGILTGQLKSLDGLPDGDFRKSSHNPRWQGENFKKNLKLVEQLEAVAEKKGISTGQLALAWVQHRGDDVIPIPGTKRVKYLKENIAAADIVLSPEDLAQIEAAVPHSEVAGGRY